MHTTISGSDLDSQSRTRSAHCAVVRGFAAFVEQIERAAWREVGFELFLQQERFFFLNLGTRGRALVRHGYRLEFGFFS